MGFSSFGFGRFSYGFKLIRFSEDFVNRHSHDLRRQRGKPSWLRFFLCLPGFPFEIGPGVILLELVLDRIGVLDRLKGNGSRGDFFFLGFLDRGF